jgi:putative transposase
MVAAGLPLHAIPRGIDRSAIFFDEADGRALLGMPVEPAAAESVCVHADVLRTHHLHLLMTPATDRAPSRFMALIIVPATAVRSAVRTAAGAEASWPDRSSRPGS